MEVKILIKNMEVKTVETYRFNGFSAKTLNFLFENRMHDSKPWFEEHRKEYNEYVLELLRGLVIELTPTMLDIDPLFTVEPAVNKTIARIYRDVRFSRDRSLYRGEMWITFMRNKRFWAGLPGYYFLMSQKGFEYGFGYYKASTESMDIFRDMIRKRDKSFLKAFDVYEKQNLFVIQGEHYKRSKYPDEPENIRAWIDLKNVNFVHQSTDFDTLFSHRLVDELISGFLLLKPIYEFICAVEERRRMGLGSGT